MFKTREYTQYEKHTNRRHTNEKLKQKKLNDNVVLHFSANKDID